jgi:3-hydroxybutyrate dehydrogenase
LPEFDPDQFSLMLRVMLEAPFRLARAALPHMYERGWGRIVNISSVHGLRASAYKSAYVAAKHGVLGLVRTLALEGAEAGITATAVCPGYVRTPLVEQQVASQAKAHGISEQRVLEEVILKPQAVKRLIEPAEVADVVAFLAGPGGRAFSGAPVTMDLGWTAA